jgi:hypothetical protein
MTLFFIIFHVKVTEKGSAATTGKDKLLANNADKCCTMYLSNIIHRHPTHHDQRPLRPRHDIDNLTPPQLALSLLLRHFDLPNKAAAVRH